MSAEDIPPDAHLLAALRHAPDRGVAPPPGLSAQILAQAQQAVAAAPASPWLRRLGQRLRALDRLLSQPALAGALATVALATVIGVMWRGGAPADGEPGLAEATVPAAVPAAAPPVNDRAVNDTPAADTAVAAISAASPPAPASADRPKPPARSAKAPPAQPPQAPKALVAAAATEATPAAGLAQPPESARAVAPAPPAAEQLASPVPQPLAAVLEALRDQPATVQVQPVLRRSVRAERSAAAVTLRQRSAADEPPAAKAGLPVADPAADRDWLAQVARAAEGRWQPVATPGTDADGAGHVVQVDGAPAGRLVLTDLGVLWLPRAGAAWHADLDAPTLQTLRAQAPRR